MDDAIGKVVSSLQLHVPTVLWLLVAEYDGGFSSKLALLFSDYEFITHVQLLAATSCLYPSTVSPLSLYNFLKYLSRLGLWKWEAISLVQSEATPFAVSLVES